MSVRSHTDFKDLCWSGALKLPLVGHVYDLFDNVSLNFMTVQYHQLFSSYVNFHSYNHWEIRKLGPFMVLLS